ncbi:hypothetical protein [Chloroflexus sp.]|uniref:hypothetical protein n=1 Tax=Chloroflexus sp. TaxID=1904827 RepID=UPI003C71D486
MRQICHHQAILLTIASPCHVERSETSLTLVSGIEPTRITISSEAFLLTSTILCGFIAVISFVQSLGNETLHRRLQTALHQAQQSANEL